MLPKQCTIRQICNDENKTDNSLLKKKTISDQKSPLTQACANETTINRLLPSNFKTLNCLHFPLCSWSFAKLPKLVAGHLGKYSITSFGNPYCV